MGKIINKYMFGSRVYGSHDENSDFDYIEIVNEFYVTPDINIHVFTKEDFQSSLNNHDIVALETFFLPEDKILTKELDFTFTLDKFKLRKSISTIASNSFVKGKKKLTVIGDYDKKLGIKSVFHSLRILDFGIQIANNGKIQDYTSSNWILIDLYSLTENLMGASAWQAIEDKYKPIFNARSSKFKELCPKMNHNTLNDILTKVVKKYDVKEVGRLVKELEYLFNTYDTNKGITLTEDINKITRCSCITKRPNSFTGSCTSCNKII